MALANLLKKERPVIEKHLHIGYAKWDDLVARVEEHEGKQKELKDEQLWTFILGCAYSAGGVNGVKLLSEILTGKPVNSGEDDKIWFEVLPIPPRKDEGNTHLDLSVGTIKQRAGTHSGIQLSDTDKSWICFCEMKWNSDISTTVTYDLERNQLARVIENALCFQSDKHQYADEVTVTLVTPEMFYISKCKSRLFQYKYEEYANDKRTVLLDLEECALKKYDKNWKYPDYLYERIRCLRLNWVTYEFLFHRMPQSILSKEIKEFWAQSCKRRDTDC